MKLIKSNQVFVHLSHGLEYRKWSGEWAYCRKMGTEKWDKSFITNKELQRAVNLRLLIEKNELKQNVKIINGGEND